MLRLSLFLLTLLFSAAVCAQQTTSQRLAEECRKELSTEQHYSMLWVFPPEYWQLSYGEAANMNKAEIQQVVDWLAPYTLVLVADGEVAPLGNVVFNTKTELTPELKLLNASNQAFAPLKAEAINERTASFLAVMKPVIAQLLGQEAKNIHFFLFPAADKNGAQIVTARQSGTFALQLRKKVFQWRTPFSALLPPKRCPMDGQQMDGAWEFCPYHGVGLMPAK